MGFTNKVVVVTGASSGIGAACAVSFAKQGANVVLNGRNKDNLQRVTDECNKYGVKCLSIIADITEEEAARRVVNDTIENFSKIDVLVNNVGIIRYSNILDGNLMKAYDETMNTNLRAAVYMTHLAAPYLIKTKGNIVNISSVGGKSIVPNGICYMISKAGLDHFTRGVAAELAPHGVRVNAISPGPVKTDIISNAGLENVSVDDFKIFVPLKRISEPVEIADLVTFLASDKCVAITGSDFVSDNGLLLKGHCC